MGKGASKGKDTGKGASKGKDTGKGTSSEFERRWAAAMYWNAVEAEDDRRCPQL